MPIVAKRETICKKESQLLGTLSLKKVAMATRRSVACDADAKALVATKEGLPSPRSAACSHCL